MKKAEAYAFLELTLRDVLHLPDLVVTPDLSPREIRGWDSFTQVEIMLAIEERFEIEFAAADIDSIESVADFARVLVAQVRS